MITLEHYKQKVRTLANVKGYNQTLPHLLSKFFIEAGELAKAVEDGLTQKEIAEEGADVLHLYFQIMDKFAPKINLDEALDAKIASNFVTAKKTWNGREIVRK